MTKIWVDMELVPEARGLLAPVAALLGPGAAPLTPAAFADLPTADAAVVGSRAIWDQARFDQAGQLKVLARAGIGYDNVTVSAATDRGICVVNTPDAPTASTAEFTIALMLSLARKVCLADRRFRAEGWVPQTQLIGIELDGKTLGLVGIGRVGSRVAEVARALRMKVIAFDPGLTAETIRARGAQPAADLPALLAAADVVSLHLPLTAQTRGMMSAREIGLMKRGALLINAARGPILVERDLLTALQSGQLAGAALDVWDPEPALANNPLLKLENVVVAPHMASASADGRRRNQLGAIEGALSVLKGERPPGLVNPEVWDQCRR
jgi:D-3-phosphoglycerate dehydrogenase / 2-oxoglutarate reductase